MFNLLRKILSPYKITSSELNEAVSHSLDKYSKTYKLLEKYDPQIARSSEILSERKDVQKYLRDIQS